MKKTENRFTYIFQILFITFLAAVFLWYFAAQEIYPSEQNPQDYYVTNLNHDWFYIDDTQGRLPMTVPGKCEAEPGETVIFERSLPTDI